MSFIESIRLENGRTGNIRYHQARYQKTLDHHYPLTPPVNLENVIARENPPQSGLYKVRVCYDQEINSIDFIPYQRRSVESLRVIHAEEIEYRWKCDNRSALDSLYEKRGECDDIIIVKHGSVTDAWSSSILVTDGTRWFTSTTPLLPGTMRALLLDNNSISEIDLPLEKLPTFKTVRLVNAMIRFEDCMDIPISRVVFQ
jgi:4-amino-4-deoxychorismate lyase